MLPSSYQVTFNNAWSPLFSCQFILKFLTTILLSRLLLSLLAEPVLGQATQIPMSAPYSLINTYWPGWGVSYDHDPRPTTTTGWPKILAYILFDLRSPRSQLGCSCNGRNSAMETNCLLLSSFMVDRHCESRPLPVETYKVGSFFFTLYLSGNKTNSESEWPVDDLCFKTSRTYLSPYFITGLCSHHLKQSRI